MGVVRFWCCRWCLAAIYRVVVFVWFLNRHPSAWYARFFESQNVSDVSISTRRQRLGSSRRPCEHDGLVKNGLSTFLTLVGPRLDYDHCNNADHDAAEYTMATDAEQEQATTVQDIKTKSQRNMGHRRDDTGGN
jgi:hypothetical protein